MIFAKSKVCYREEPACISRKMYAEQHHAKIIPHIKLPLSSKKGKNLINQYLKNLQEMRRKKKRKKQYQSKIPIKQFETQSIRSGL